MIILRQKEFASARQRKKNAKNAVKIVNDAVSGNMTAEEANKALGKIQARQGSGKVLEIKNPSGAIENIRAEEGRATQGMKQVRVKAQSSSRQARHLAEGIGNGNPIQTTELTQRLDKDLRGGYTNQGKVAGTGVHAERHVIEGGFKASKPQRVEPSQVRKRQMEERANRKAAMDKQRSELRARQKQEAAQRKSQRLAEKQSAIELDAQKQAQHIADSKAYQASKPKPTPTPTTPTQPPTPKLNTTQTSKMSEGFLKRNWNKLGKGGKIAVGTGLAATAVGTGLAIKKRNKE